jgi:hypothetical protein
MGDLEENVFWREARRRKLEEEKFNLEMCLKHFGRDPRNVCGPWAMKVCAREGFMLEGPFKSCYRASCRCQSCRALSGHSETQSVQSLAKMQNFVKIMIPRIKMLCCKMGKLFMLQVALASLVMHQVAMLKCCMLHLSMLSQKNKK